jgi:outer membrane protein OmpA-like peptidoglycan-associated protein
MNAAKYFFVGLIILSCAVSRAQLKGSMYGAGISFGTTIPRTTVPDPRHEPYTRVFVRYFPNPMFGVEGGVGLGVLEAATQSPKFFSSLVAPADIRLMVQPLQEGLILPFAQAGVGIVYFNPVDQFDKPLKNNAAGVYSKTTPYVPIALGAQYSISDQTAVELSVAYNVTFSKHLDDDNSDNKNDSYLTLAVSMFGLLSEGNLDKDSDGITNAEERQLGTDPTKPDTDGDGLRDGEEIRAYRTDPLTKDSDGDDLTDYDEVFSYKTNPLLRDSDSDGLSDGDEILKFSTNPLKADTDDDGLNDGEEVLNYHTNPLKSDSDGDSLSDGDEVIKYRTDPLKIDTDGDGLTDADERLKYRTNPLFADTDEGGVPDGREVAAGTNPLNPKDDVQQQIRIGTPVVLEGVTFETGSARLTSFAKTVLDKIAEGLLLNPKTEIAINGHTDNQGSARFNLKLSQDRANAVKDYLVSKGVSPSRIQAKGYGFTQPIADNNTEEGRIKNRRIEFVRIK